jgi:uncharacterized protein involved in exopolysaccharide biosynthesis
VDEFVVESPVDGSSAPVDPRRALLLPLWRGRYLVLVATLLGVLGGLLSGVTRPNSYRSVGKLMIRAGAREELTPEMSVTGNAGGFGMGGRNVVNDEMHLLGTLEVYEEAARVVTPAEVFRPYDPSELDSDNTPGVLALFHRWQSWWFRGGNDSSDRPDHSIDECEQCRHAAALVMARNLSIQAEPGSDVITVSYTAHDSVLARKVVAAFLEAAIAHHRKIYETNTTLEFLGGHMEQSLRDLTSAENDLTNFKTECEVFDFENQQRTLITEIQELEGQTAQDQSRLAVLRVSTKDLGTLVASLPETIEDRTEHNLQPNPERAALKQRIYTLEDNLAALERRVGGTTREHDLEREQITHSIDSAKQDLDKQPEFVDAGPSLRKLPNPRRERLMQQLDDGIAELSALEASAATRSGRLVDRRARLQSVAQCEPRYHSLEATTNEARSGYEHFRSQHEKASLMGSMDQLEMSNLRRIQEATLPHEKEGPLRGKLVLLGVLLGGVAGCGLAFARNMFDHRLHDATDVEQLLGTPVLGLLPRERASLRARGRAKRRAAL